MSTALTSTPPIALVEAMKYSGLAAAQSSDQKSVLHMYWQDTKGNILEGDFSITNFTRYNQTTVVDASDAKTGTPLSVIVWPSQSSSVRVATASLLCSIPNGTEISAYCFTWEQKMTLSWLYRRPQMVGCDRTVSSAAATSLLAMVLPLLRVLIARRHLLASGSTMVRDYLSASVKIANLSLASGNQNSISEASGDLQTDDLSGTLKWRVSQNFLNTDAKSGVGCTISGTFLRIYVRNTSDVLEARLWDFTLPDNSWQNGTCSLREAITPVMLTGIP